MVFSDDMANDQNIHDVRLSYNRMASLLVFVANAFTLMYVGKMNPEDSIWYGLVSGSFTFAVLTNASITAESMQEFRRSRTQRQKEKAKPMGMRMMPQHQQMVPQMMPQQQQMIPQQQPMQQQMPMQQPMQPMMKQQNFIPPDEDNEYVDPVTGEIKPIQEAEMLD